LKNYIIRIYRQENDNPKKLVGVVEEPEIEGKKAFTNLDELWGILNPVKAAGVARRNKENQEAESSEASEQRALQSQTRTGITGS
jgi:hypothetical protein